VWVAVFTIPAVILVCWAVIPGWEPRIRIAGMFLELLGLSTVAFGLRETRKLFDKPSLFESARQWLRNFPKFKFETRIVAGSGHINLGGGAASAFGTASLSATASLEERVAFLENGLNQANMLIHQIQQKIDEEARKHGSAIDTVRQEIRRGDENNQQLVKEAMAGGLYIEITGAVWLLFGITLATASNEIASVLFGTK